MKLQKHQDPMGQAIHDYHKTGQSHRLIVKSSQFDDDEMPVHTLFRTAAEMPSWERHALKLCTGHVLDVGAGSGCHSLELQQRGVQVTAIDISPFSVETMHERGVTDARWADLMTDDCGKNYDTILMLMNGLGISGTLRKLPNLLRRCEALLSPGGCILGDSSDIRYVFEDEDGNLLAPESAYYGEVDFRMMYHGCKGPRFHWLYVDFPTLATVAASVGMKAELLEEGPNHEYLTRIRRMNE